MKDQEPGTNENGERPSGWFAFNEKPVMVQLREPYIGCSYNYAPSVDKESGGVRAVPILSGVLFVEPDGNGGILLVIRMPTGNNNDFCLVAFKPSDVVFVTHIHQARVITQ